MNMPLESTPAVELSKPWSSERNDGLALGLVFTPALIGASLLYLAGLREVAAGVAGVGFLISMLIAPEVGLYVYLAGQALDQMWLEEQAEWITPGKIIGPLALIFCLLHGARSREPMRVSRPVFLALLALGVWGLVTAAWAVVPLLAIKTAGQMIVQALLIMVAIDRLKDRIRLGRAHLFVVLGAVIGSVLLLSGRTGSTRFARATLGEFFDPNSVALGLLFGLFSIPVAWSCVRRWPVRAGLVLAVPLIVMATVLTGSRMGLVMLVGVPVLGMLLSKGAKASYRLLIPIVLLVVVVVGFQQVMKRFDVTEYTRERYEEMLSRRLYLKGEARALILLQALEAYVYQPMGCGYGNGAAGLWMVAGVAKVVHDNFFSLLFDGGPPAFLLAIYAYWLLFQRAREVRAPDLKLPAAMMFVTLILSSMALQTYSSKYFWIPITLCLLLAEQSRREELGLQPPWDQSRARAAPPAERLLRQLQAGDRVICPGPVSPA